MIICTNIRKYRIGFKFRSGLHIGNIAYNNVLIVFIFKYTCFLWVFDDEDDQWNQWIYIIIAKNIRYLLWNQVTWRFFHDTYLTIEVEGIRCTNHLHDSCPLTDINPHLTAPGCRYYFKINSWWPVVTSWTYGPDASYCDVTMAHYSHGYLWTHDVEVGASKRDCDNLRSHELFGTWWSHFAYRGRMIHCSLRHTGRPNNLYTVWVVNKTINLYVTLLGLTSLFTFIFIFGPPCFNTVHR